MSAALRNVEADFDAAVAAKVEGRAAFLVYDVDDIGTGRAPVCPYGIGELLEACDHADNRGGFVVNAAGQVVHVSPTVSSFELLRSRRGRNNKARPLYDQLLAWIREHRNG